jgi:prevent-host-death family protein
MTRMAHTQFRAQLTTAIDRVRVSREPIVVTKNSRAAAALVPVELLEQMEKLMDANDVLAIEAVRAELKRTGAKPKPWDQVQREIESATPPVRKRKQRARK